MWIYGDANNAGTLATGMYIELGDDDNSDGTVDDMAKIYYSDPRTYSTSPYHDANDLWRKTYYQWGIALEDFNDDNNVNPEKIKTIAFGVNGGNSGQIYYDDIRLYVPRCLTDYAVQFGNLVDPEDELDCYVDEADLDAMSDDWLLSDLLITSTVVDDSNLVVKYVFDDVNGLNDVSGAPYYHGVAVNDVSVHDGVMTLDNDDTADFNTVEIGGIDANMFNGPFTVVMDVNIAPGSVLFGVCPPTPNDPCDTSESYNSYDHAMTFFHGTQNEFGTDNIVRDCSYVGASGVIEDSDAADGQWHTVATTSDGSTVQTTYLITGSEARIAINIDFPEAGPQIWVPSRHKVMIGYTYHPAHLDTQHEDYMGDAAMRGDVDNFRVYDVELTPGQVMYAAGIPQGNTVHIPVESVAEIYDSEPQGQQYVNFRDEAVLANNWLQRFLWPQNVP
jgi:hypothetical protein